MCLVFCVHGSHRSSWKWLLVTTYPSVFFSQRQRSSERLNDLFKLLSQKLVELRFKPWLPNSQPLLFPLSDIYTTFHQQYTMYAELLFSGLKMNLLFSTSYSIMYVVPIICCIYLSLKGSAVFYCYRNLYVIWQALLKSSDKTYPLYSCFVTFFPK